MYLGSLVPHFFTPSSHRVIFTICNGFSMDPHGFFSCAIISCASNAKPLLCLRRLCSNLLPPSHCAHLISSLSVPHSPLPLSILCVLFFLSLLAEPFFCLVILKLQIYLILLTSACFQYVDSCIYFQLISSFCFICIYFIHPFSNFF